MDNEIRDTPLDEKENAQLIARVDLMMDPKLNKQDLSQESENDFLVQKPSNEEPIDIFADIPGAPPLTKPSKPVKAEKAVQKKISGSGKDDKTTVKHKPSQPTSQVLDPVEPAGVQNYDDPGIGKVINEIVAAESDQVLALEDSLIAEKQQDVESVKNNSHKLFWTIIFFICLIALTLALYIISPRLFVPLNKIHWSSIKRHL